MNLMSDQICLYHLHKETIAKFPSFISKQWDKIFIPNQDKMIWELMLIFKLLIYSDLKVHNQIKNWLFETLKAVSHTCPFPNPNPDAGVSGSGGGGSPPTVWGKVNWSPAWKCLGTPG